MRLPPHCFRTIKLLKLICSNQTAHVSGAILCHSEGRAPGKKSQYTITCEVLAIEDVGNSVKLGLQMP